jgi:hypothetical protein
MKTNIQYLLAALSLAAFAMTPSGVLAAAISPSTTGDTGVAAVIGARANLALASAGGVAFSSSDLTPDYAAPRVNDGVINQTGNSWIQAGVGGSEFVGVRLAAPAAVAGIVFHGETGYNGRSGGTWVLQYTKDATPSGSSTWTEIGTYVYNEAGCATPMLRSYFAFPAVQDVTGIRLVLASSQCGAQMAVQELEAYGPVSTPPNITSQPTGGTVTEGDIFTFTVLAEGAESIQWRRNGNNIPGATGSSYTIAEVSTNQAGSYTVVVGNASGSVTSNPAILQVTPAPSYATYTEAILTDNPIHYYPLDDTTGTTATDLGSLATTGGTFAGGFTLAQDSVNERLGKCLRLDGNPGSLVDLGLFHPGDSASVEAWVRLDTDARSASFHAIVARWDGSYELDINNTDTPNFVVRRDGNGFGAAAGTTIAARSQWHHMVGIFNNGVVTMFVDGVKGSEQNIGGVLQNAGPAPDRVMIGATRSGTVSSFNFKGLIDEVAIYDYALSAAQVRAHFKAIQTAPPSLTIQPAVIISWPSFPPGYVLQSANNIAGPYLNYTNTVYPEGNLLKAAVPLNGPYRFFQLFKP